MVIDGNLALALRMQELRVSHKCLVLQGEVALMGLHDRVKHLLGSRKAVFSVSVPKSLS